jgi:hydroxymethylbilane synthase
MPVGVFTEYDEEENIYKVWAAKSAEWNKMPVSIYMESKHPESLAEKVVSKISNVRPASVFITRNLKESEYFFKVLNGNGFSVSGRSLIEMKPVSFKQVPKTDWIFFSSKHAVNFFFNQKPKLDHPKFACVGKSTAATLRKFNVRADFIGYSTDTKLTGKQFASRVGDGTVLFPQAKGSLKSVQSGFVRREQVIDLIVYETLRRNEEEIPKSDIMVFTSPSNVESYFEKNKLDEKQKVVAMGDATAGALRNFAVSRAAMPQSFDDLGLVRAVFGI